ncbi:adenosine receptor A3-like [Oculina patagonica]
MNNYSLQDGFLCDPTVAVHPNSSQLSTVILVVSGINIVSSITATLGNALILVALSRESSLNPPSKLFLRCLAFSDLCVGLLVQPVAVVSLLSAFYHRWKLCRVVEILWYSMSMMLTNFSLGTLIAISADRLLALLLSIRYRQVVTMKRARLLVALFSFISVVTCVLQHTNLFAFLLYNAVLWFLWLMASIYCYVRIYLVLRNLIQAQVTPQGQPNAISPLNLSRYKKTVSTALWLFAAMMICYAPYGLVLIVSTTLSGINAPLISMSFFTLTLRYLNSSLNPILYCWKIRELRHAVMEILSNLGFCKICRE